MDRYTGRSVSGVEQVRQRVEDVVLTPVGTRVERRDYGSRVPDLIDEPGDAATALRVSSAVTDAVMRHVPELILSRVRLIPDDAVQGRWQLRIEGRLRGEGVELAVPMVGAPAS
ncbi:GPW/gp25 family protein [Halorhodospira neutriphila]|nr:GPW/gp25 family protein [Halorhodospira neutriphila]